jgi:hypothetical protein
MDCCLAKFEDIWATVASIDAEGVFVVPCEADEGRRRIYASISYDSSTFLTCARLWQ